MIGKSKGKSVFEYLAEECGGKLTVPTEADLYLFTVLSYAKIERFLNVGEISAKEFADRYEKIVGDGDNKNAERFVRLFGNAERYKDIVLFDFETTFDSAEEAQFAALSLRLPGGAIFVSFRGTDGSLVGWKEDFNLSYSTEIPAERRALCYLDKAMDKRPTETFYVGGHSKGGILAMYAASKIGKGKQDRIAYVMDCDCPGFNKSLLNDDGYNSVLTKIHSFIPKYDLVGLLFGKKQEITVISSSGFLFYQHSPWTWCLSDGALCHLETFPSGEELSENALNHIMETLTAEEIKFFVDTVYKLVSDDNKNLRVKDLAGVRHLKSVFTRYRNLPDADKKNLQSVAKTVFRCLVPNNPFGR